MWNCKFKTRVKTIFLIVFTLLVTYQFVSYVNKKSSESPQQYTFAENFFASSNAPTKVKTRNFKLERADNEKEIVFENLENLKKIARDEDDNRSLQYKQFNMKKRNVKKEIYEPVIFKQIHDNLQHKIVHLDLKGAPPKLDYLKSLLSDLRHLGATGLLIEYEDMFPYTGQLEIVKANNAYDPNELLEFLAMVKDLDLEVIPLVQTFGHLEYMLKLKEFRHLREVDDYPDSICPSNDKSSEIITEMINQIITFHSKVVNLKWIHIGCDEVYQTNQCSLCQSRNVTSRQIFTQHILKVAEIIKNINPSMKPLIWDDMLRSFNPYELQNSGLGKIVEPVVWVYASSIKTLVSNKIWYQYTRIFPNIWIASAYKGASGATNMIPKLKKHYTNHLAWLNFVYDYQIAGTNSKYKFRGIMLTGWSRYHHFAVLCEILPVSIPSLILNMILIDTFLYEKDPKKSNTIHKDVFIKWKEYIGCSKRLPVHNVQKNTFNHLNEMEEMLYTCNFKGRKLYNDIKYFLNLEDVALNFHLTNSYKNDGLLFYNVDHNLISRYHVKDIEDKAKHFNEDVTSLMTLLKKHMKEFFDESVIMEFIEYRVEPVKKIFERVINATDNIKNIKIWDKRPYR